MKRKVDSLLFDMLQKVSNDKDISDLHLKAGIVPVIRKLGSLKILDKKYNTLTDNIIRKMFSSIMTLDDKEKYEKTKELDLGFGLSKYGRFRINIFQQRGSIRGVIRSIPHNIPDLNALSLPEVLKNVCYFERGLILVTGATGSGKSSTVAAMIDHINKTKTRHILTLEDPIEFLISDCKSIISQRELGIDMKSFDQGLRAGLRQDSDIIFIGEMRDVETIRVALLAAETGHLVISTLHTVNAKDTINRILNLFPQQEHNQIRYSLAASLQAILSQRLIRKKKSKKMIPLTEVLLFTTRVRKIVREGTFENITDAIEEGAEMYQMHSFDQRLVELIKNDEVDWKEALSHATNSSDLKIRMRQIGAFKSLSSKSSSARANQSNNNIYEHTGTENFDMDLDRDSKPIIHPKKKTSSN